MRTSSGLSCEHEDQLIPGLCACCDKWGESHGACVDCSAELDDEDAGKDFIHEGHDGLRRCTPCHEAHDRQFRWNEYVGDVGAWYANLGGRS